jgi:apolipoprotein N-acyltransferase
VLVVDVPSARAPTVYARTGEIVPLVALAFSALVVVQLLRSRRRAV